jgi:single-stranded DNA-binding protein
MKIFALGRLTREVEVKKNNFNGQETFVLNNSLAIKQAKDKVAYIDITAWGNNAELMGKYLKKGDELVIYGELRNGKRVIENNEITTVYCLITKIEFVSGNRRKDETQEIEEQLEDDEVPF